MWHAPKYLHFSSLKTTGTYWKSLYYFHASMKYETWAPLMHWPWIVKNSKNPPPGISTGHCTLYVHTQHTSITMTSSTSTSSQLNDIISLNVIININVISSQCHQHHQSSNLNIIINTNNHLISIPSSPSLIISSHYHQHPK